MKKAIKKTTKMKEEFSKMDFTRRLMEYQLQINYLDIGVKGLNKTLNGNRGWLKDCNEIADDFHDEIYGSLCFIIDKMELNEKIHQYLSKHR